VTFLNGGGHLRTGRIGHDHKPYKDQILLNNFRRIGAHGFGDIILLVKQAIGNRQNAQAFQGISVVRFHDFFTHFFRHRLYFAIDTNKFT